MLSNAVTASSTAFCGAACGYVTATFSSVSSDAARNSRSSIVAWYSLFVESSEHSCGSSKTLDSSDGASGDLRPYLKHYLVCYLKHYPITH